MPKQSQRKTGVELCRNCGRRNFFVESSAKEEENPWPRTCLDSLHARIELTRKDRQRILRESPNLSIGLEFTTRRLSPRMGTVWCVFTTARDHCGQRNCTGPMDADGRPEIRCASRVYVFTRWISGSAAGRD